MSFDEAQMHFTGASDLADFAIAGMKGRTDSDAETARATIRAIQELADGLGQLTRALRPTASGEGSGLPAISG
jgi:hypothetical protein